MKRNYKKWLAELLSASMILGMSAPMVSYAEEAPAGQTEEVSTADTAKADDQKAEKAEQENNATQEKKQETDKKTAQKKEVTKSAKTQKTEKTEKAVATQSEDADDTKDAETSGKVTDYATFMADLKILENYAETYAKEHKGESETELVINFIRTGVEKYKDGNWKILAGEEKTAFTSYVADQDKENGTSASDLKNLEEFTIPNGQTVEFGHMFGCMNITYYMKKTNPGAATIYADLSGWGGDICDLMTFTKGKVSGDVDAMAADIQKNYLGVDDPSTHTFGILDIYGDMDAFYIMDNISESKKISDVMSNYYNKKLTDKARAKYFVKNRFPGSGTKEEIREALFKAYKSNDMLSNLESSRGLGASDADLREACSYAFADYLSELTGVITDKESNNYYNVFSSVSSKLAPGITQQIKQATTADNKQIVYYIATADVGRKDVSIYANYKDNKGGTPWGMQRVTDQMAAAQKKHSDPTDKDNYIANYNTIVGVNGDFYNMSTGEPLSALIMEGKKYHDIGSQGTFFGIQKDGTPIVGDASDWAKCKDDLKEAVGGNVMLVKDGKAVTGTSGNYYNERVPRTCVGVTADNKVVLMVLDGRQEPVSAGGSAEEVAQIMLDAGCVDAVNLDGGGSSTFAAKTEGSDDVSIVNRPSDGYERSVSSSLVVVSTAKSSTEFDHALVTTDDDYLTVGTKLDVTTSGVSATGNAAELPKGSKLTVSDEEIGTVEDGVFTAKKTGNVTLKLVADGEVLGSKTLHVVVPDKISFTKSSVNAICGVPCKMPIQATYQGNKVAINENDIVFGFMVNGEPELESKAGTFDGFNFIGDETSGIRVIKSCALLNDGESEELVWITINLYKQDEAMFDFDNVTGGDRSLAWNRTVTNSKTSDDKTYYIENPEKTMDGNYTFAVDMSTIPIPEKLKPMISLLPGGDDASATAWSFLMQLAERVSTLTNVQVNLKVNEDFDIDTTNLKVVNDYFDLTEAKYDKDTHTLSLKLNFKKQSEPIDEDTANPICIVSGVKVLAKDNANWKDNQITASLTGKISYDIYLRSSAVYGIASDEENQKNYGLYPFINPDGSGEKGAHFANDFSSLEDEYVLDKTNKQGWIEENGHLYYYKDNVALTGIQKLPGYKETDTEYYYDLGDDGVSKGKISGVFDLDHSKYFAKNGVLQSGWQAVSESGGNVKNYYFDKTTYKAVNGEQTIDGYHYLFEEYVLKRGDLRKDSEGTKYMWAGSWATQQWKTIDGKKYYFRSNYNAATGIYAFNIDGKNVYYVFGDDGVWQEDLNGMYTDKNGDTYWIENGIKNTYPGLVCVNEDEYYYFAYEFNGKLGVMIKNRDYWISKTNDLMKEATYHFDENGRMTNPKPYAGAKITWKDADGTILKEERVQYDTVPDYGTEVPVKKEDSRYTYKFKGWSPEVTKVTGKATYTAQYEKTGKDGLCVEGDDTYWIKDGKNVEYPGLVKVKNANGNYVYYYFDKDGKAVKNVPKDGKDYWVEKTNGLLPKWGYYFDKNGVILHDDLFQNGIQKDKDGVLCYYIDGIKAHMGMIKIGDDYYYVKANGQLVVDSKYYCTDVNGLKTEGSYEFDKDGKMILPDLSKNGIIDENGSKYYYVNGIVTYAGLIQIDGAYYYVKTNGEVVHGRKYWISKTNGLLPEKSYTFDENGKIELPDTSKNGIIKENNSMYYYEKGVITYAGLIQIDGAYYYVKTSGEVIHGRKYWISKTNGLLPEKSYTFDENGKIIM